jgi:hypothetical protein
VLGTPSELVSAAVVAAVPSAVEIGEPCGTVAVCVD